MFNKLEEYIDLLKPWFKQYFGDQPVSEHIKTIAWMFFLNEYLMGYVVYGNDFETFMKEIRAMKLNYRGEE